MVKNTQQANEPQRQDVNEILDVAGVGVRTTEVKVELDRISQILNDVKGDTQAIKANTESIDKLIRRTRKEFFVTIFVAAVAIIVMIIVGLVVHY